MICSNCGKETTQIKEFMEGTERKSLCPPCYKPYYEDSAKRVTLTTIPELQLDIELIDEPTYTNKDKDGKKVKMTKLRG